LVQKDRQAETNIDHPAAVILFLLEWICLPRNLTTYQAVSLNEKPADRQFDRLPPASATLAQIFISGMIGEK